jgi:hypothetical protein
VDTATVDPQDQVRAEMEAAGISPDSPVQADYFGFDETHTVYLPDGKSFIQHKTLTEGDRRNYLDKVNKEVRVEKVSGDMRIPMAQGAERHILLDAAIVGWNLVRDGQPVPFSKGSKGSTLAQFLESANPKIIDEIEKDIRKRNPWLLAELSVEEIDKQIADLEEMKAVKQKEEAGNAS